MENNMFENESSKWILRKVMFFFGLMWFASGLGIIISPFVPPAFIVPLVVLELILVIAIRNSKKGKLLILLFAFVSGSVLNTFLTKTIGVFETQFIIIISFVMLITFMILGLKGFKLKEDLSGWGKNLFIGLIILLAGIVAYLIFPLGDVWMLCVSGFGVILFALYTTYDFNLMRHKKYNEADVPSLALNLYLDSFNLILFPNLLRIVNSNKK